MLFLVLQLALRRDKHREIMRKLRPNQNNQVCKGLEYVFDGATLDIKPSPGGTVDEECINMGEHNATRNVVIHDGVAGIGIRSFLTLTNIRSVSIPASVTDIGKAAFGYENELETFTVAAENEHYAVDKTGFLYDKVSMTVFRVPPMTKGEVVVSGMKETGVGCFAYCFHVTLVKFEGLEEIGDGVFEYCMGLRNVDFGDNVKSIGDAAFMYCLLLTSIDLPDTCTSVGQCAFGFCSLLKTVDLGLNVAKIGEALFLQDFALESVTLSDSITEIPSSTFQECQSLKSVKMPANVVGIGESAFYNCLSLTSIEIPSKVELIGRACFVECPAIKEIVIPDSVRVLDMMPFSDMDGLIKITIGNSVKILPEDFVAGDPALTTVVWGSSVTTIEYGAFELCTGLTELVIPDTVDLIGDWAFSYCSSLTSIKLGKKVASLGEMCFYMCANIEGTFVLRAATTYIGFGCFFSADKISALEVEKGNPFFYSDEQGLMYHVNHSLYMTPAGKEGPIVIPEGIEAVMAMSLYRDAKISEVTFPSTLNYVGVDVANGTVSLTDATFLGAPKTMEKNSLAGLEALTRLDWCGDEVGPACEAFGKVLEGELDIHVPEGSPISTFCGIMVSFGESKCPAKRPKVRRH